MLALKPKFDRIEGQHAVDREMPADIPQERNVFQPVEPIGVIRQDGVAGSGAESDEWLEVLLDAGDVAIDCVVGQKLAAFILAGRVADLRGAAAH